MNGIRKEFEFYNYVFNRLRYIGDLYDKSTDKIAENYIV